MYIFSVTLCPSEPDGSEGQFSFLTKVSIWKTRECVQTSVQQMLYMILTACRYRILPSNVVDETMHLAD